MGKTTKKSEAGTLIKGQTSLNRFFSKQPPGGQSKLFTQVLLGSKPPTALPPKTTASRQCFKITADDDDCDFQPVKKLKSPPSTNGKNAKPAKPAQGKEKPSARKSDHGCEKPLTVDSLIARHLHQDKLQQTFSKDDRISDIKAIRNVQHAENNSQDFSGLSPGPTSKTNSSQKAEATICVKPEGQPSGYPGKIASQENQGSPITVIPETPEVVINSNKTKSRIAKPPFSDDVTPTRNIHAAFSTFVPETPTTAKPEDEHTAETRSKIKQRNTSTRGGVRHSRRGARRSSGEGQPGENSSSFKFLEKNTGSCVNKRKVDSPDLLQEMLQEYAQSVKTVDVRKDLPTNQSLLCHGLAKSQGTESKPDRNPFASKSDGLVPNQNAYQDDRPRVIAELTSSVCLETSEHSREDINEMVNPSIKCDLDVNEKQGFDPLEEMLHEYAASSILPTIDSAISNQSKMKLSKSLRGKHVIHAARPSSKLSKTFRKKQRSDDSPAKLGNLIKTEHSEILFESRFSKLEADESHHCKELQNILVSTAVDDSIDDQISGHDASEKDLLDSSAKKKSANPFALRPSKVKLKASVLHKTSSGQSKPAAFKTRLNTRKRSPCKGNSPYAKRMLTSHPVYEVHNSDTDRCCGEINLSSPNVERIPEVLVDRKAHSVMTAKKSLFQDEKENFLSGDSEVSKAGPSPSSDTSPTNLVDKTNMSDPTGTGSPILKERNSPSVMRVQEKLQDSRVGGITEPPAQRETNAQPYLSEISDKDQHPPAVVQDSGWLSSQENVLSSQGTGALWEDQLNDSFLAAMDMEYMETGVNAKKLDSIESQVTREFSHLSPFKSTSQKNTAPLPADLNRYRVTGIQDGGSEKKLQLLCLTEHKNKVCCLKGTWLNTLVEEGDMVAVHGRFDSSGMCTIDQQNHFLVVHPDRLLTGTNISRSIHCMRRSVLSEKFKGMDKASKPMLLGTILHDVFDKAIEGKNFAAESLLKIVDRVSHQLPYLKDMYAVGMTEQDVLDDAQEYVGPMKQWADRYLQPNPKQSATVDVKMPGQNHSEKYNVCISGVKDIEETVWSPRWGTKGKVDLTVEVKIHQRNLQGRKTQMTVPLELKTGRQTNSIEHRSQLVLYSLMLDDVLDGPASDLGLLLYLKTGAMLAVPANHMDKRELIHLRNQLAYYISLRAKLANDGKWMLPWLPAPIEDDFTCGHCPQLVSCALLQRMDNEMGVGHQLSEAGHQFFRDQLSHLCPAHVEYFSHWYLLCTLEGMASEKKNLTNQIWSTTAQERELSSRGQCLSGLLLAGCRHNKTQDTYHLTFKRSTNHLGIVHPPSKSILEFDVSTGDRVVVSVEGTRQVATCTGFVESITSTEVKIKSERPLQSNGRGSQAFRLDKDDAYNTMASSLVNLAQLMRNDENAFRLRKLIVELSEPGFDSQPQIPDSAKAKVAEILSSLNTDQQTAINSVLKSHDYTLIIGMPGTGKTTTIVALVRILYACNLSVLLTSYTHSAVDNILLKLTKFGLSPLRLGEVHRIHPELAAYSEKELLSGARSVQQLASLFETKLIVATTCLGAKHALLTHRMFDVCIVDEASQISQLVCLGPLFHARRFVLVGDHKQLPPLVQSGVARQLGMDESLFQRLGVKHESHPLATVQLSLQYRMNSDIMMLSNALVYEDRLQCGNEKVSMATLRLPKWDSVKSELLAGSGDNSWTLKALQPATTVCFLNTDKVKSPESLGEKHTVNSAEAMLVKYLVFCLMKSGCTAGNIGVISPYRNQCKLLGTMLDDGIEVNTVDKYQGRDKEVIIVSFTVKDQQSESGFLLQDIRRLNVALTRAKLKLILIGCIRVLRENPPMEQLIGCLQTANSISDLPVDACSTSITSLGQT
ncbi:DNA replication ATP-dependent helicase/nuclease DNA2-like isoform X2 [Acanthaster planci]|uniref:DNA replication ATP-dependent helicase/nuclease DNA2 n=1 Tax=Acanthaster planci TaxID=133434 RepID=A0A8B8A309_ACAPL|nr:DNA replication ATP-dependent helicase/nuclease DNA2-like isoform X2 [Acanthaster planci]